MDRDEAFKSSDVWVKNHYMQIEKLLFKHLIPRKVLNKTFILDDEEGLDYFREYDLSIQDLTNEDVDLIQDRIKSIDGKYVGKTFSFSFDEVIFDGQRKIKRGDISWYEPIETIKTHEFIISIRGIKVEVYQIPQESFLITSAQQ